MRAGQPYKFKQYPQHFAAFTIFCPQVLSGMHQLFGYLFYLVGMPLGMIHHKTE
jgi:hypothetical protein